MTMEQGGWTRDHWGDLSRAVVLCWSLHFDHVHATPTHGVHLDWCFRDRSTLGVQTIRADEPSCTTSFVDIASYNFERLFLPLLFLVLRTYLVHHVLFGSMYFDPGVSGVSDTSFSSIPRAYAQQDLKTVGGTLSRSTQ